MRTEEMIAALTGKDTKLGCDCYELLMELSARSPEVYETYWDAFAGMLDHPNAYTRIRSFGLIVRNARWDAAGRLDADALLAHVFDIKPIVTRKHVELLPELVGAKPDLRPRIRRTLENADLSEYADSMRPLVEKDCQAVLQAL